MYPTKKQSKFLLASALFALSFSACKKTEPTPAKSFETIQTEVLNDFTSKLASPLYGDFLTKAKDLNNKVIALCASPDATKQAEAQAAWRSVRELWEQSEGFLIGPVDDNSYDPHMDTWPTDRGEMDALLVSTKPLDATSLGAYDSETQLSLRGFHPLEYLLWQSSTSYTARQKEYMLGLAEDILNSVTKLNNDWPAYATEFKNAGQSGSRYTSKKDAYLALADALVGICGEVAEGKMLDPFGLNATEADSSISESPYSGNSMVDFKNNIIGAYNVYLCKYNSQTGTSLSTLVAANNKELDQSIKTKFEAAIASFDGVSTSFEKAIYIQRPAVQNILNAIGDLKTACDGPLQTYIQTYVKN